LAAGVVTTSIDDVFINCPFDRDYAPIFRALIFTISCVRIPTAVGP